MLYFRVAVLVLSFTAKFSSQLSDLRCSVNQSLLFLKTNSKTEINFLGDDLLRVYCVVAAESANAVHFIIFYCIVG